jgi:hypothetical protein
MNALRDALHRFAIACACAMAFACAAQQAPLLEPRIKVPKPYPGLDVSFIVDVPREVDFPCVGVQVVAARVLVSRKLLEALASARKVGADWKSESERMAMIRGERARELLGAAKPAQGMECAERALGLSNSIEFLLGDLLLAAKAAVVDERGSRPTAKIRVRYHAGEIGGFVTYYLDRGEEFISYSWFLS